MQRFMKKSCTFFGHRDVPDRIYEELKSCIKEQIEKEDIRMFYFGDQGKFDRMVLRALKECKKEYPDIKLLMVAAYFPENKQTEADEIIFPEELEGRPKRLAILLRNQYMIEKAACYVFYVNRSFGGAAKALEYAKKKNKIIINLYESEA